MPAMVGYLNHWATAAHGHTENHIPKKNIEEDMQSTTSSHQVLTEKHELIYKKKSGHERESSTASNKNASNLTKKICSCSN
ncbi:hypothetical protein TNCV_3463561 [Trichonephila clavipes]|nr:hypothetical protein TNCV_3463561 [Trichonephila clavipes]